eukprot:g30551.t1
MMVISATLGEPQFGAVTKLLVEMVGPIDGLVVEHSIVQTMLRSGARLQMKEGILGYSNTQTYAFRTKQERDKEGRIFYREEILSARQYIKLLSTSDPSQAIIKKVRRTFVWQNQHFILDEFSEPPSAA